MVLVLANSSNNHEWNLLPNYDSKIPLKSIEVKGEMIDFVGHVTILQIFQNNYSSNIEAKYMFNLDEQSNITGMKMRIGDRILTSQVLEKTEARNTYESAIHEKKTTCLLEKALGNGIYTVNVGNILQKQEIQIEIEYITKLECGENGEMKFLLPTNISPKYDAPQKTITDLLDSKNTTAALTYSSSVPYTFKVDLLWRSNNVIKEVKSLTNEITVEGVNDRMVRISCETAPRNGDFNVFVTTDILPAVYLHREGDDSYLMINHRIKDEMIDLEGGEFIILVDRSGSMEDVFDQWSGSATTATTTASNEYQVKRKIDYAREATRLFVQSLPMGSKFNVFSFGSNYQSLFPYSVEYDDTTKQEALGKIATFQADMGGTELFGCLSDVLSGTRNRAAVHEGDIDLSKRSWKPETSAASSKKKSNEKIILLMTDGDVGNVDAVVSLIRQYSFNSRVFTIGIGQDVNRFLCEKVAHASNACSEIMIDNPNISMVVAKMLDAATKSYYKESRLFISTNGKTTTSKGEGQSLIVDIPKPIYSNRFHSIYHKLPTKDLLREEDEEGSAVAIPSIRLQSVDGVTNLISEWILNLEVVKEDTSTATRFLPQLYAADLIQSYEQSNEDYHLTKEIIELSCRYHIMNGRTSFVVVDERENATIDALPTTVSVPHFTSTASRSYVNRKLSSNRGSGNRTKQYAKSSGGGRGSNRSRQCASYGSYRRMNSYDDLIETACSLPSYEVASFCHAMKEEEEEADTSSFMNVGCAASPAVPLSTSPEQILDGLLNFLMADGSFTFNASSLVTSQLSQADFDQVSANLAGFEAPLVFNLIILKMLKAVGNKKYVMIVRNLEKWISKQLLQAKIPQTLATILQSI